MPKNELILSLLKELTSDPNSSAEKSLKELLREDPSQQKEADQLSAIWSDSSSYKTNDNFDSKAAFAKFQKTIAVGAVSQESNTTQEAKVFTLDNISTKEKPVINLFRRRAILAVAAMGILLVTAGAFFFQGEEKVLVNEGAIVSTQLLPDGTEITLSPGATLALSTGFSKKDRNLEQQRGQIYYDVAKNTEMPFQLSIDDLKIIVTGTSFNVKWNKTVQLDLIEGSLVIEHKNSDYQLSAGQQLVFDPSKQSVVIREEIDPNAVKWTKNGLSFNSTPIEKVLKDIESFYGVNIDIDTEIPPNCHFTSPDLTNVSLNDLFSILLSAQGMIFDRLNSQNYTLVEISCKE